MKPIGNHIIKCVAVLISIAYLLSPLRNEVVKALHSVVHNFNDTHFVLGHNHDNGFKDNVSHSLSDLIDHEHEFLDIVNAIIGQETEHSDSKNSTIEDLKIDKHFFTSEYNLRKQELYETTSLNFRYKVIVTTNFYKKEKIPPQLV
ncbi:hypothetical protein [Seonamhaeicola marinus]|uniref:Uncharacterized protein n=1 Tax=Seonamhaeicola marinus TaxID=1912246 RepID=A0A5D0HX50_9FLAO|nr:hypothetical protein [Seonamhaeicola marinus]TYA74717.1 hypothetical protein FUA24_15505 [Seonamhaeicola marinus]